VELPLTGERTVPGIQAENYWFRRHEAAYEFLAPQVAGCTVLEVGCGEGYGTDLLAGSARHVVGIDYDALTVAHARATYSAASFVRANLAALPVPSGSVDVVATLQVVEHVWDHAEFVDECRRALLWILRDGGAHGLATSAIVTTGHSAGGHLSAMLHATDWRAHGLPHHPVRGAVSLSGVHDLEPLVQFSYNDDLRLTEEEARRVSPVHVRPATRAPIIAAVGANETSEFLRQTDLLWEAWPNNRPAGAGGPMRIPDRHHFDVVLDYADADSALTRATMALFG